MYRLALRMMMRDKGRYVSLVVGLAFATLLIAQQGSIFLGLLKRSTGPLQNVGQPDLWVGDPHTRYIFELRNLSDRDLARVRSVPGIEWAEPFITTWATAELRDGAYKRVQILGLDRSTLVGQPPEMLEGSLDDLRMEGAVIVEQSSRPKLNDIRIGDTLKLNDRRGVVVGFCRAKLGFESNAVLYSTVDNTMRFTPMGRERISFILVKAKPGVVPEMLASEITAATGLGAWTPDRLSWLTIDFILKETGIGINFGITVLLGFIVGLAVVAAIFYQFTLDNLRHFAVFKAMGARTKTLVRMVLLQALTVGAIGFGIGCGAASAFSLLGRRPGSELAPIFPPWLFLTSAIAMLVCICLGSVLSLRRVIRLEPAIVFK